MSDAAEQEIVFVEEQSLRLAEPEVHDMAKVVVADVVEIVPVDEDLLPTHRHARYASSYSEDGVKQYLNEISVHPLIKREDEVRLAKAIEAAKEAHSKLEEWGANPPVFGERQERLLAQRVVRQGQAAKQELINSNLRLVVSIARKFTTSSGMPLLDLVQEGNLGLMHAIDKFDWQKGFKLSTYATFWITQYIRTGIADSGRLVRVPRNISDNMSQLIRVQSYFESINEVPDDEKMAAWLEWEPEKLERVRQAFVHNSSPSLNAEVGEDESTELGEFFGDPRAEAAYFESQRRADLSQSLIAALKELPPKQRDVIIARFGLLDGKHRTLEEVGKEYGVTRERIRQIEGQAMRVLRHNPLLAGAIEYTREKDF